MSDHITRFEEDLQSAGYAERSRQSYTASVYRLQRFLQKPLDSITRTSHRPPTATTDLAPPASLCFVGWPPRIAEDTPSATLGHRPCRQCNLSRLATKDGEKSGITKEDLRQYWLACKSDFGWSAASLRISYSGINVPIRHVQRPLGHKTLQSTMVNLHVTTQAQTDSSSMPSQRPTSIDSRQCTGSLMFDIFLRI